MKNYGELKAGIASWLDREDLTSIIPQFVRQAEEDIFDGLRCHDNEFVVSMDSTEYVLPPNPPIVTTNDLVKNLPSNYREMRLVTWNDRPLKEVSQQRMQWYKWNGEANIVSVFSVFNRQVTFGADVGDVADWEDTSVLTYSYYGAESLDSMASYNVAQNPVDNPAIEDTVPEDLTQTDANTNRMLQRNPQIYLWASLRQAYIWLREPDKAAAAEAEFAKRRARLERSATELTGSTVSVRNAYTDSLRSY